MSYPTAQPANRLVITLLALVICIGLAYVWPDADGYHSASQKAAIAEQGEAFRMAKAAKEICGDNAAYSLDGDMIQCMRHTGAKTIIAKIEK